MRRPDHTLAELAAAIAAAGATKCWRCYARIMEGRDMTRGYQAGEVVEFVAQQRATCNGRRYNSGDVIHIIL